MARRRQQQQVSSGAPGVVNKTAAGAPALNPLGLQQANRMPYGNYLDPTVALQEIDHPSTRWAGLELQPIKPRM
jgi:hypothetical protein